MAEGPAIATLIYLGRKEQWGETSPSRNFAFPAAEGRKKGRHQLAGGKLCEGKTTTKKGDIRKKSVQDKGERLVANLQPSRKEGSMGGKTSKAMEARWAFFE